MGQDHIDEEKEGGILFIIARHHPGSEGITSLDNQWWRLHSATLPHPAFAGGGWAAGHSRSCGWRVKGAGVRVGTNVLNWCRANRADADGVCSYCDVSLEWFRGDSTVHFVHFRPWQTQAGDLLDWASSTLADWWWV